MLSKIIRKCWQQICHYEVNAIHTEDTTQHTSSAGTPASLKWSNDLGLQMLFDATLSLIITVHGDNRLAFFYFVYKYIFFDSLDWLQMDSNNTEQTLLCQLSRRE